MRFNSCEGFRGVKPLKSLRPYGTVRPPPKGGGRWGAVPGLFAGANHPISNLIHGLFAASGAPMADTDMFFSRTGMDRGKVQKTVDEALATADDGELFLEYSQSESFSFDDNRLKAATFDTSQGFGLRAVAGDATGYAHATELSEG